MDTIVLSGATGFLGSHLLEALIRASYRVVILKRSTSNCWRINHLLNYVTAYDIDHHSLESIFEKLSIYGVIHTACDYGKDTTKLSDCVQNNLLFSVRLLDQCRNNDISFFINTDTLLPADLSPYSLSKKQFRDWLKYFALPVKVINVRIEQIYGPNDDSNKFLGWLLEQFEQNAETIPLTAGDQKRDFIYISDVVNAFIILIKNQANMPSFIDCDIATGTQTTIRSFVENVVDKYQNKFGITTTQLDFGAIQYREKEPMSIKVNLDLLQSMGWKAHIDLDTGIKLTIDEWSSK